MSKILCRARPTDRYDLMHIAHRVKLGLVLAAVISIDWMGACLDGPGGRDETINVPGQP